MDVDTQPVIECLQVMRPGGVRASLAGGRNSTYLLFSVQPLSTSGNFLQNTTSDTVVILASILVVCYNFITLDLIIFFRTSMILRYIRVKQFTVATTIILSRIHLAHSST